MKLFLCAVLVAAPVGAQEVDFEAIFQSGVNAVDQGLNEFGYEVDREALAAVPRWEDLVHFWNSVERTLNEGSVADMAWLRPEVDATLEYLEQWPAAEPYADWLRQQADYFAVAEEVAAPEVSVPKRPAPTRPPQPLILPAPPTTSAPPVQVVVKKRVASRARTAEVWRKRVKDRPLPKRADTLIPVLKDIFREQGLPEQLVWLAEVESSLDPKARSPVGAAGLFQLMPPTAKRFGLSTRFPDERLNPEKSARAAATYLRFLHKEFGSWPLALAAYNAGEGRVGRLLAASAGTSFEAIADELPAETQLYVPKVAAVLELREKTSLDNLPAPGPIRGRSTKN
jgi:membrane-bound lytic murein transglycosylase D